MNNASPPDSPARTSALPPPPATAALTWLSPVYGGLGLVCTALGIIGLFVPGLPTTVFLIVALWAFSRSSDRLTAWLWRHPRFGPPLRMWHQYRVIAPKAKLSAVTVMALSVFVLALTAPSWQEPAFVALIVVPVAVWICTRRSRPPPDVEVG